MTAIALVLIVALALVLIVVVVALILLVVFFVLITSIMLRHKRLQSFSSLQNTRVIEIAWLVTCETLAIGVLYLYSRKLAFRSWTRASNRDGAILEVIPGPM
ncbi:hypothetical protein CPB85DRAFT_1335049 [Mucidula mucida]|nr:hypothetical protein CPB85DRAFT_1335049 [Mucidula mucida]